MPNTPALIADASNFQSILALCALGFTPDEIAILQRAAATADLALCDYVHACLCGFEAPRPAAQTDDPMRKTILQ